MSDENDLWVVAYIHHTCSAFGRLSNEWDSLTKLDSMKGRKVKFGYVVIDSPASQDIIANHTIGGTVPYTPTVYVYGKDKQPVEYTGEYLT